MAYYDSYFNAFYEYDFATSRYHPKVGWEW
jgi:hypothetical protein